VDVFAVDDERRVFFSPDIDDWSPITENGISIVIDLDGDLDIGVPTVPNHMLYVYFPIEDEGLPDIDKLHAVAQMGASLVRGGHRILAHCGMGLNRSALVAGLIAMYLGMQSGEAIRRMRELRPAVLFNETFADYLATLDGLLERS
jgi:protein-tyrosine phosphatase